MIYTLRIVKEGAAVLDGTTPLDLSDPAVTVDRSRPGEIEVTIPDGTDFGLFDPGGVLEFPSDSGNTYIVEQLSAVSDGGAYPAAANVVQRVTPAATAFRNAEIIANLGDDNGLPTADRRVFMFGHELSIQTTISGPHTLSFLIKTAEDADFREAAVDGPNPTTSPAWLLGGNTNGGEETLGTNDDNALPLVTNGVEQARITSPDGFMGVGTAAPVARVHAATDTINNSALLGEHTIDGDFGLRGLELRRTAPGAVGANFGYNITWVLQGFSGNGLAGRVAAAWEVAQTNDVADRDARMTFEVAQDAVLVEAARFNSDLSFQVNGQAFSPPFALTDAANIAVNANESNIFTVTLAGNRTLDNPTGLRAGAVYTFIITQDGAGSRTLAYDTAYTFPGGIAPILSNGPGEVDVLTCICDDGVNLRCIFQANFS